MKPRSSPLRAPGKQIVELDEEQREEAFSDVKLALTSETVLVHYNSSLPVKLSVDASPYGLGVAIMHVYPNGHDALLPCHKH